jgi:hypothetical protein
MLSENGLLSSQMAYPRVAYDLRLTLHLEVPSMPTVTEHVQSRALEPFPLADAPDAILESTQLKREIDSPNVARVLHQLPIEVTVTGQDGHTTERLIDGYTPESVGMTEEQRAEPDLSDVSDEVKRELGL